MQRSIILAAKLFEHNDENRMTFYCLVPDVKEGYMALNLGFGRADYGFWNGLHRVLSILNRSYRECGIELAVSPALFSIIGQAKQQVTTLLDSFSSYQLIPADTYYDRLDIIHELSIADGIKPTELKGYTLVEAAAAALKPPVASNEKLKKHDYYTELSIPYEGVVLDFETTSPIVEYAKIIEISALKFRDGQIIDTYNTLVNPKSKIPKQVRLLTGITDQDVADMPTSFQALKQLNRFLQGTPVLVGHNIQYDYRVLKAMCKRANTRLWTGKLLCTLKHSRQLNLPIISYDLSTLCEVFDIVNEQPHRAWADTKATFELMKCIYQSQLV
ncbi:PolC-type DNA polymerase III [Paenibacillus sp. OV219]|uniref:3'-5' exonuclease n=1 Tax=Paenibacillus sp. OV219 TaxID=1884377 RepID=UPI0008ABC025|nr:3'-5' exonuclease [Paenibacillus sp. OV219]SEM73263.1 Exonuclease [Paenibacillus sp. OV219]